jgi:cell wall-associated NlpC family hydrolase
LRVPRVVAYIVNVVVLSFAVAVPASAQTTGGAGYESPETQRQKRAAAYKAAQRAITGPVGTILPDGTAVAPPEAPPQVHAAVQAANAIVGKPYRYGGGHAKVEDSGYDCSGTVSYALGEKGANILEDGVPLDSSSFMRWGERGPGQWITVYTNPGHAFVVIAGMRLDTSAAGDPSGRKGPRWRPTLRSTRGFRARHFEGL